MNTGSKHYSLLLTLLLAAAFVLGACGSTNAPAATENGTSAPAPDATAEATAPASEEPAEPDEAATRTVATAVGDIEIPADPQRVVVDWNIGHLLALGLTPVGVPYSLIDYGLFLKDFLPDTVEDIGSHQEVSIEKIIALEPDLIITWGEKNYEMFAKIAPTLVYDTSAYNSMEEEITALGELLGRQTQAAEWNASFDSRLEAARSKIAEAVPAGSTFTIVEYNWDNTVLVMGNSGNRGGKTVYELLGLTPTPKVQSDIIDKEEWALNISWELLGEYTGDYIIDLRAEDNTQERVNKIWTGLPAVQNNQVYEFNIRKYFNADPISYIQQAEEIAESLSTGRHVTD